MIMKTINFFSLIISNSKKLKGFYSSLTNLYKIYLDVLFNCLDNNTKIKLNIFFSQLKRLLFVGSILIEIIQFISLALFLYNLFKFSSIDIFLSWLIYSKIKSYISSLIKSYIVNVISFIIDNNNSIEQVYNKVFYKILKDHYKNIITINIILIYFSYSYKSLFFIAIAGLILGLTLLYLSTMLFIYINFINKNINNKPIIYLLLLIMSLILIVFSLLIIRSSLIYINDYIRVKINGSNPTPNTGPPNPGGPPGSEGGTPSGPNGPSGDQPSGGPSRPPGGNDKTFYKTKNISKYKRKTYEANREAKRRREERDVLLHEENPEAYDEKVERYKFNNRAKRVMTLDEFERRKKLREKRDAANMRNRYNSSFDLNLEGRSAKDLETMIAEGNRIREGYIEGNLPQTEQNPPVPHYAQETDQNPLVSHNENISQPQGFIENLNYPTHDSRFSYTLQENDVIPYNSQSQTYLDYSMQNPPMNYSNNNPYLNDYNNNPYLQNNHNNPNVQNNTISDNYTYNNPYTQNSAISGNNIYNNPYTQDNTRSGGNTVTITTNNPVVTYTNNPVVTSTNNPVTNVNITDILNTTKNSANTEHNRINISDMLNTPKQPRRINISDMVNSPRPESNKIRMKDILNP